MENNEKVEEFLGNEESIMLEDLEIDILELDDIEGVPATAASSGSGGQVHVV